MFSCFVWFYGETQWFHLLHLEISLPPQVLRSLDSWQLYALLLSLGEWQVGSGEKERRYVRKGGFFVPYFAETPNQKMKVFRFFTIYSSWNITTAFCSDLFAILCFCRPSSRDGGKNWEKKICTAAHCICISNYHTLGIQSWHIKGETITNI